MCCSANVLGVTAANGAQHPQRLFQPSLDPFLLDSRNFETTCHRQLMVAAKCRYKALGESAE